MNFVHKLKVKIKPVPRRKDFNQAAFESSNCGYLT